MLTMFAMLENVENITNITNIAVLHDTEGWRGAGSRCGSRGLHDAGCKDIPD